EELCEKIEQYGLKNVEFTGRVEPRVIPDLLAEAHIFVTASVLEVQSLSVIEGLAAGKPVVGLSNQTVDEFVDESCGAVLPQNANHQAFAEAVMRVADAPNYEVLCQNARQKVSKHDWDTVIHETVSAYQTCLKDKPQNPPKITPFTRVYAGMTSFFSGVIYWVGNWAK
ncbi:MAG TPA: glycosyltransferase family 4 protein, partial [Aggregatilineales bacterium]|nr:glycosyltransferase family 4 protein [Aggregatilineales bacterium]